MYETKVTQNFEKLMESTEIKTVKYWYYDYNSNSKGAKIKNMYEKIFELTSNFGFYQEDQF